MCTAAERGYALEAWRVLDPQGWMIPLDQREWGGWMGGVLPFFQPRHQFRAGQAACQERC